MSVKSAPDTAGTVETHMVSGPAERLLHTATNLFSHQGIRSVGIDQILREAGVAKASLYSSYGSKDALVIAYLESLDQADRNRWEQQTASISDPVDRILAFFDLAALATRRRGFRGCLYANAATEFPDTELAPVTAHRHWVRTTVAGLLTSAGIPGAAGLARTIALIYDGALVGSKIERSTAPIKTARSLVSEIIAHAH